MFWNRAISLNCFRLFFVLACVALPSFSQEPKFPAKTGVETPGIQSDIAALPPIATFIVKGHPDWLAVTDDAVWVASSNVNHVVRLDAATNKP